MTPEERAALHVCICGDCEITPYADREFLDAELQEAERKLAAAEAELADIDRMLSLDVARRLVAALRTGFPEASRARIIAAIVTSWTEADALLADLVKALRSTKVCSSVAQMFDIIDAALADERIPKEDSL